MGIAGSSVSSITADLVGTGYSTFNPSVSISGPNDTVNGVQATATATVTGDGVSAYTITNAGLGYTAAPIVQVEFPAPKIENVGVGSYFGDAGEIVGYGQSATIASLTLFIPPNSYLRDDDIVKTPITVSQLQEGDLFTVNVSANETDDDFDGIYKVAKAFTVQELNPAVGVTTALRRIEINNVSIANVGTSGDSSIYGQFSWGKMTITRSPAKAKEFAPNPYTGISTAPLVQRARPLKTNNYIV